MKLFTRITRLFNKKSLHAELQDGNQIIGDLKLVNSKILFEGKNNIFYVPRDRMMLYNSTISFCGNNSVIFMCATDNIFNIWIHNNSVFYLGAKSNVAKHQDIVIAEQKHIIIGNQCIYGAGVSLSTSDAHAIYDSEAQNRINYGKSIYIGDHVWIGQQALLWKGARIHSGSIIGAGAVLGNKTVPSNCCFAGNPAKLIKKDVCFTRQCVYGYSTEKLAEIENGDFASEDVFFQHDPGVYLPFDEIDSKLNSIAKPRERIDYLAAALYENKNKNRFAL